MKEEPFRVGSLYAGVGGIDLAFEQAGFSSLWANEYDKDACNTYRANFSSEVLEGPVEDLEFSSMPKVDVITSGFPCVSFSIAGHQKGFSDPRGRHFFHTIEAVSALRPKCLFFENVKNLASHDHGYSMRIIERTVRSAGYSIDWRVVSAEDHGVPQNRERIYAACFKDAKAADNFEWPATEPLTVGVYELLEKDVPEKYYYERFECHGKIFEEMAKDPRAVYQWRRHYVRKNKSGVCPTLTANMGTGGHNVPLVLDCGRVRKLTPRECFRVMSFPDYFVLPEGLSDSTLYKCAGNSVCVKVVEKIACAVKKALSV